MKNTTIYTIQLIASIFISVICVTQIQGQICVGTPGQIQWELYDKIYDDEISIIQAAYEFPTRPKVVKTIYKTRSPINYDNYIGGRMRGFISSPDDVTVTFNITGDDKVNFYLSTDDDPANKVLLVETPGYTALEEHDKYPEQTTGPITLTAEEHYYFEIVYVEGGGGDHASLWWQNPNINPTEWLLITDQYLSDVGCEPDGCPAEGTPCDDGDATTSDDIEDGFCHCIGKKATTNTCIGDRGQVQMYRYDNIPGGDINDLYNAPNYPANPDYSAILDFVGKPSTGTPDEVGTLVQGYLRVPVTGNYKFNLTGEDNTVLFISSDEDPANKQTHQAIVSSWTYMTQHDKWIWQSTGNIFLNADQYYYIEINHKQGGGNVHFSPFWQTPYTEVGQWKRIPSIYFYDYTCEIACISEGVACDDGNPFTNDDAYNDNCECVGTPCEAADCDDPLASYIPYDKCGLTEEVDNNFDNNWESCIKTLNPNNAYGETHWIMYDLGARHEIHTTHIWNYNVPQKYVNGFESVAIDYSDDGMSWTNYGNYNWPLATGDSGYAGFEGPNFMGIYARYILITSLDTNKPCQGLGKCAFNVVLCPLEGTPCDDGDRYTFGDQYNDACECIGTPIDENDCTEMNIVLGDSTLYDHRYGAEISVESISEIADDNIVGFVGGSSVILEPGFRTGDAAVFVASIDPCDESREVISESISRAAEQEAKRAQLEKDKLAGLQVIADTESDYQTIRYHVAQPGHISLTISRYDNVLYTLAEHEVINAGVYKKVLRTKKLDPGVYQVSLSSPTGVETERMVVK